MATVKSKLKLACPLIPSSLLQQDFSKLDVKICPCTKQIGLYSQNNNAKLNSKSRRKSYYEVYTSFFSSCFFHMKVFVVKQETGFRNSKLRNFLFQAVFV